MKKIILATIMMVFAQTAGASSYYIECTTADGSITNLTGHAWETQVRYKDWKTGKRYVADLPEAELEIIETLGDLESTSNQGQCDKEINSSWGSASRTYVIKAKLNLPKNASDRVKEVVGTQAKFFICEESTSWQSHCE